MNEYEARALAESICAREHVSAAHQESLVTAFLDVDDRARAEEHERAALICDRRAHGHMDRAHIEKIMRIKTLYKERALACTQLANEIRVSGARLVAQVCKQCVGRYQICAMHGELNNNYECNSCNRNPPMHSAIINCPNCNKVGAVMVLKDAML